MELLADLGDSESGMLDLLTVGGGLEVDLPQRLQLFVLQLQLLIQHLQLLPKRFQLPHMALDQLRVQELVVGLVYHVLLFLKPGNLLL